MSERAGGIAVVISAQITDLVGNLNKASAAVKASTEQMSGFFGGLSSTVKNLSAPFAALAGVLAGGALFKSAVSGAVEWNTQAVKMARQLGITTEEASALNLALGDIGVETSTYSAAAQAMTRQLIAGGKGFKALGIDVKDSAGNLRPTTELISSAIDKLNGMKAGTDRNVAGVAVFGRAWGEVAPLLRLSSDRMEEARKKAADLHLLVGPEGAAQTKAYKEALNDVDDIFQSLKVQVGNAVLPLLTKFGAWLGSVGPELAETFAVSIKVVVQVFLALKVVIETLSSIVNGFILASIDAFTTLGQVVAAVFRGDFSEALEIVNRGADSIVERYKTAGQQIVEAWKGFATKSADLWNPPATKQSVASDPEGGTFDPDTLGETKDKSGEKVQAWKEQLEELKALESNWFSWSTARELDFWQAKLGETKKGTDAYRAVLSEVNRLRKDDAKETHENTVAALQLEIQEAEGHAEEQIAIQRDVIAEEIRIHGEGSKEVLAARRKLAQMEKALDDQRKDSALALAEARAGYETALVDIEADAVRRRADMGEISARQEIEILQRLEREKYEIRRRMIEAQLEDDRLTTAQREILLLELERLEREHGARMGAFRDEAREQQAQFALGVIESLRSTWTQGLDAMLAGTLRFGDAVKGIWSSLTAAIRQAIARMVVDWIAGELRKLVASQTFGALVVGLKKMFGIQEKAIAVDTAVTEVAAKGASAAAGAASSAAAIPVVGWAMAIPIALGVLAAVMALKSNIGSAAGGWDIGNENPLAQLHKREMVLPAHLADRIRNMTDDGGEGGSVQHVHNWNVQTPDARSFLRLLRDNDSEIAKVLRELARDHKFKS
jgi:hypothetical protein